MKFSVLTLFPELLQPWTQGAILGKAAAKGQLQFELIQLRDFAQNKHHKVDDTPYGGGAGMVLRVDVVERALATVGPADEVVMLSPAGQPFTQAMAEHWATLDHLVLLCGRYEGFDARTEQLITREVSIGDFVMMGGEAAAACMLEAVGRLVGDVLGDAESHQQDSFSSGLLDYPEYTRPALWHEHAVPSVLSSGDHGKIQSWRRRQALARTLTRRPDLLASAPLSPQDSQVLLELGASPQQLREWNAPEVPQPKKKRSSKNSPKNQRPPEIASSETDISE